MPRYYFHLRTPHEYELDEIGLDLDNVEVAYLEACCSIPGMSADLVRAGANPASYAFDVVDVSGIILMEVPFSEILDRGRKPILPGSAKKFRKARAEMARTSHLIDQIREVQGTLKITLAETWRLLNQMR